MHARDRIGEGVVSACQINCSDVKIVKSRKPKERAQGVHDNRTGGDSFVDYLHSSLIVAMDNHALMGPQWTPAMCGERKLLEKLKEACQIVIVCIV